MYLCPGALDEVHRGIVACVPGTIRVYVRGRRPFRSRQLQQEWVRDGIRLETQSKLCTDVSNRVCWLYRSNGCLAVRSDENISTRGIDRRRLPCVVLPACPHRMLPYPSVCSSRCAQKQQRRTRPASCPATCWIVCPSSRTRTKHPKGARTYQADTFSKRSAPLEALNACGVIHKQHKI